MSEDRTYITAGISTKNGGVFLRVASIPAADRTRALIKDGQTAIDLRDLPKPMTREQAREWLIAQGVAVPADPVLAPRAAVAAKPTVRALTAGNSNVKPLTVGKVRGPSNWAEGGDDAFPIRQPTVARTVVEQRARNLHRKAPFIRQLSWDHLTAAQQQEFLTEAQKAA